MSDERGGLALLAQRAGVHDSYRDAWGEQRQVPPESLRGILASLGFEVDSPAAVEASLRRLAESDWRRAVPPVVVVREDDQPAAVPVTVPSDEDCALRWRLVLEDGEARQGEVVASDCRHLASGRADGQALDRVALALSGSLPLGYHDLTVACDAWGQGHEAHARVIVVPRRGWLPPEWERGGRSWGIAVQLYTLRSERNWGMGDLTDLRHLVEAAGRLGADAIGLNPLHALFPVFPRRISPYSPSSRTFLNTLYIDVEAVPDYAGSEAAQAHVAEPAFRTALDAVRASTLVDYGQVARLKHEVLELLYADFRRQELEPLAGGEERTRGAAFRAFQQEHGADLHRVAVYDTLCEHFSDRPTWRHWPEEYRDPDSPAVAAFAERASDRVDYYAFLQWEADRQLAAAGAACEAAGMAVGIYFDLALGVDDCGADAWRLQDQLVGAVSVGAPPDDMNLRGQDWGLPPLNPVALYESAYAPFVNLMAANMRRGRALRIDHVLSLRRLYMVPHGRPPTDGGYVDYPIEHLRGVVALESRRNRCLVIGEDLGTVPEGFREAMHEAAILSYRLMYFEKNERGMVPAEHYPELALAAVTTHDLPPLAGWWSRRDIDTRRDLGLFMKPEQEQQMRAERDRDVDNLLRLLVDEGLLPSEAAAAAAGQASPPDYVVSAIYDHLGRSPAKLVMVHPEDLLGVVDQVNMPATVDEHPNWQRRMPVDVEALEHHPLMQRVAAALNRRRGRPDGS